MCGDHIEMEIARGREMRCGSPDLHCHLIGGSNTVFKLIFLAITIFTDLYYDFYCHFICDISIRKLQLHCAMPSLTRMYIL